MSDNSEKIRYILQFYYDKGKNAAQARQEICAVYGEGALSKTTAKKWFARFRSGNLDVKDARRPGRPVTDKVDEMVEKVEQNRHISSHDIAKELNIDKKTVVTHLRKAGYERKLNEWVPIE